MILRSRQWSRHSQSVSSRGRPFSAIALVVRVPGCIMRLQLLAVILAAYVPQPSSQAAHSNDEFVRNVYRAILCREGDEAGIAAKVQQLVSKELSRSQMIMLARFSSEYHETSAYIPEALRGKTDGECGACSACLKGDSTHTACCPGAVLLPADYDENAPIQAPYFKFAPDETCADCIVGCPKGWASMAPNTGPAKCSAVTDLPCCEPHSAWGTIFLVVFVGVTAIYIVAGTVYGFQHGKDGYEALPNITFWVDTLGLIKDGVTYTSIMAGGDAPPGYERLGPGRKKLGKTVAAGETEEESAVRAALDLANSQWEGTKKQAKMTQERSRLIEASMLGEKEKVKSYAKKDKGTLDLGDKRGFTAYHHGCANGHADVVKALLKAGANSAMMNDGGRTGWDLAHQMGRGDVEDLLSKLAAKGSKKLKLEAEVKVLQAQSDAMGGTSLL